MGDARPCFKYLSETINIYLNESNQRKMLRRNSFFIWIELNAVIWTLFTAFVVSELESMSQTNCRRNSILTAIIVVRDSGKKQGSVTIKIVVRRKCIK